MDPITKALHETWKKIVSEANDEYVNIFGKEEDDGWKPNPPKRGVTKGGKIITINDPGYRPRKGREHIIDGSGRQNTWQDDQGNIHVTYGIQNDPPKGMKRANYGGYVEIGDDYKEGDNLQDYYNNKSKERKDALNNYFNPRKPKPTPGGDLPWIPKPKVDDDDLPWIPKPKPFTPKPKPTPTPGKTPYDDRGGSEGRGIITNTNNIDPKLLFKEPDPRVDPYIRDQKEKERRKKFGNDYLPFEPIPKPTPTPGDGSWGGSKPQPIIPTRTPAPQPAAPATTGSGLLNSVLNTNKKMYNSVISSLPSMPKLYEERDAEGQMAKGELMIIASKAQELARMMKDDTQLEAWVQSKITKAKDYISSVHDYMNGNPDKID